MLTSIKNELQKLKNPAKAKILARFFKTGKGEYGEGDIFLGVVVPLQRQVAKKYIDLSLVDCEKLLGEKIHEYRLVALLILVAKFKKADRVEEKKIYNLYLKNARKINNWDLVDLSAPNIVGQHLIEKSRDALYKLLKSKNIWERRIAIISTFAFIRKNQFADTLRLTEILMTDKHDLIHKATGWMLREVGKRDEMVLEEFLKKHYKKMPRVMLRYAIERMGEEKRRFYLRK